MKTLTTAGWLFFVLDAFLVLYLFVSRNIGDDTAGRGMARGFSYIGTLFLVGAGAVNVLRSTQRVKAGDLGKLRQSVEQKHR
jgi:hypothetical protein